jgi:hypothetical protein
MESIFNGLLEVKDQSQIKNLVDNMDNQLAIKLLEFALEGCTDRFTLLENHIIYNCLQTLKNANQTKGNHLHNDDTNGDIG